MDRSRLGPREQGPEPPASSRLTVKAKPNRRRPTAQPTLWSRVKGATKPAVVVDACGRALRRSLPALIGVGVLAAIGGTAWAGYHFVTTSSRFAIAEIHIRGNHHLTTEQIRDALPIAVGDNVFAADLDTVTRQLRTNPWIESVDAHRILPHTIVIDLREHVPVAIAELGGLYLADASGHPFTRLEADSDRAGLPVITGLARASYIADPTATAKLLASTLEALAQWNAEPGRPAIGEVHVDPHDAQLVLYTFDHATAIHLGALDAGLTARMRTFDVAWAELGEAERVRARALHLDIRSDHVTVAF